MNRNGGNYVQGRIWHLLKRKPGLSSREVGLAMNGGKSRVVHVLRNMRTKGTAKSLGDGKFTVWYAMGAVAPEDGRGEAQEARIAAAEAAKRRRMINPAPKPATELERCLGWFTPTVVIQTLREMYDCENMQDKGAACAHSRQNDRIAQMERELYAEAAD